MKLTLDLDSVRDYQTFLKIKSLPVYSFTGREASFPDEYASRLGLEPPVELDGLYSPRSWMFDYQRAISALAIRRKKFACFVDCGLGKTVILFEFARHVLDALPKDKAVLIVSPSMVVNQTIGELVKFYGGVEFPLERVRASGLQDWLVRGSRFGITNYEAISDKIVDAGRLGALILDESSLLKSSYGRWGTRLIQLGKGLDWKLCLTGTPAPNDRIEYANHAVFLDRFPNVNSFYAKYFVNRGQTSERWEIKPHAMKSFYRDMSHWCIFLSRPGVYGWKDNAEPMPPIRVHMLDVPLTGKQWDDAIKESNNLFGVPSGIGSRQKIATIAKSADGNKPEFVADLVGKEKTACLVWCRFNAEQDELFGRLPEAANITGTTSEDKRVRLIEEYQSGDRDTLISKSKILGLGLNLQITRRMVFSTLHDSWEEYYQCVKRANRYGSKHSLDVYIPITELEQPMLQTVLAKAARVEQDTLEQEALFKEVGYVG